MSKKISISVLVLVIIIVGVVIWKFWPALSPENKLPVEKKVVTMAGSFSIGPCYPSTVAMVKVWNTYLPDVSASAEVAPSRLMESLKAVEEGKYSFRWAMGNMAYYSYTGTRIKELKKAGPMKFIRTIGAFWNNEAQILVREDSPINDISDLKNRESIKVATPSEAKWMAIAAKEILGVHSISPDKVKIVFVPFSEVTSAVKKGNADLGFVTMAIGTPMSDSVKKTATGLRVLSLKEEMTRRLEKKFPYYVEGSIPANTFPHQLNDIKTVAVKALPICSKDMDPDLVYELTKATFSHLDEIKAAIPSSMAKSMSPEKALEGVTVPLHPGAKRYYIEAGLMPK